MIILLSLFISIIINVLLIFFIVKTGKNKLLTKIEFLKEQLKAVKNHKGNKKYRTTIFQKIKIAITFIALKKPVKLCYVFKPETILRWYKNIVKKFWTFYFSKTNKGRPPIPDWLKDAVLKMKKENPKWGCRRISDEIKKKHVHFYNNYRSHQGLDGLTIPEYLNKPKKAVTIYNNIKKKVHRHSFLNGILNHYTFNDNIKAALYYLCCCSLITKRSP